MVRQPRGTAENYADPDPSSRESAFVPPSPHPPYPHVAEDYTQPETGSQWIPGAEHSPETPNTNARPQTEQANHDAAALADAARANAPIGSLTAETLERARHRGHDLPPLGAYGAAVLDHIEDILRARRQRRHDPGPQEGAQALPEAGNGHNRHELYQGLAALAAVGVVGGYMAYRSYRELKMKAYWEKRDQLEEEGRIARSRGSRGLPRGCDEHSSSSYASDGESDQREERERPPYGRGRAAGSWPGHRGRE